MPRPPRASGAHKGPLQGPSAGRSWGASHKWHCLTTLLPTMRCKQAHIHSNLNNAHRHGGLRRHCSSHRVQIWHIEEASPIETWPSHMHARMSPSSVALANTDASARPMLGTQTKARNMPPLPAIEGNTMCKHTHSGLQLSHTLIYIQNVHGTFTQKHRNTYKH